MWVCRTTVRWATDEQAAFETNNVQQPKWPKSKKKYSFQISHSVKQKYLRKVGEAGYGYTAISQIVSVLFSLGPSIIIISF